MHYYKIYCKHPHVFASCDRESGLYVYQTTERFTREGVVDAFRYLEDPYFGLVMIEEIV